MINQAMMVNQMITKYNSPQKWDSELSLILTLNSLSYEQKKIYIGIQVQGRT